MLEKIVDWLSSYARAWWIGWYMEHGVSYADATSIVDRLGQEE